MPSEHRDHLEEQQAWLDDLLVELERNGALHIQGTRVINA
jgi:hypothetical protein